MGTSDMLDYYNLGQEENRLARSLGRLEQIRTWEIMRRYLPPPPARVLDVGGGTGVYALPLAARGYRVQLIDAVPLHVERARSLSHASETPLVGATVGDARTLEVPDASFEVVLLLGPLYHLIVRDGRVAALAEARRVLVPGGLLLSAHISRFASACDGIQEGMLRDAAFAAIVEADLTDGIHRNPTNRPEWFTTAYFHRPEEIGPEIEEAGLRFESLIAVEGPGWVNEHLDAWLDDDAERGRLLGVLRRLETEPSLIGASAHLLAVAPARERRFRAESNQACGRGSYHGRPPGSVSSRQPSSLVLPRVGVRTCVPGWITRSGAPRLGRPARLEMPERRTPGTQRRRAAPSHLRTAPDRWRPPETTARS